MAKSVCSTANPRAGPSARKSPSRNSTVIPAGVRAPSLRTAGKDPPLHVKRPRPGNPSHPGPPPWPKLGEASRPKIPAFGAGIPRSQRCRLPGQAPPNHRPLRWRPASSTCSTDTPSRDSNANAGECSSNSESVSPPVATATHRSMARARLRCRRGCSDDHHGSPLIERPRNAEPRPMQSAPVVYSDHDGRRRRPSERRPRARPWGCSLRPAPTEYSGRNPITGGSSHPRNPQ